MTEEERAKLLNEIYAAVFEVLQKYETRGFNAHHRAQHCSGLVEEICDEWIERQRVSKNE